MGRHKYLSLWASGSGTNVENIIHYFSDNEDIQVAQIIVSHPNALVIHRAIKHDIPYHVISREKLKNPNYITPLLHDRSIDYIILAGFIWKIPSYLIEMFPDNIVNIHPALLPKYGGKGMYGNRVHQAIIDNREKETGISIHLVNDRYDDGKIILQKTVKIEPDDNIKTIQEKVHNLEYKWYPVAIEKLINKKG